MAKTSFICLSLCLFLLCTVSLAQIGRREQQQQQQGQFSERSQCRIENLRALEPVRRVESEGGVMEFWDQNNEQLQCAGMAVARQIIEPRGLHLPEYANAPRLLYIEQGRGITGPIIPGCPETFHSTQQSQQSERSQGPRFTDQHQQIRPFRQGDIIAMPAGVAHWCYNDGETNVVAFTVFDTSSIHNQLDRNLRKFQLSGNEQQQTERSSGSTQAESSSRNNVFSGFDVETLAEAFGVSTETARKLQNQDDQRGSIVRVEKGLEVVRPQMREEDEYQEQWSLNGLEEIYCSMTLRENIADPTRADVYTPQGGRVSSTNSQKLPILGFLQLSAERGVLYRNALYAPQYNINSHSVVYATRGSGRIQVVGDNGRTVFDDVLSQGQVLVIPQMFAVMKKAGDEGFEYVAFKTNDNAMSNPLVGKASAFRAMPEDVLVNAYQISREEARRLKYNRGEEMVVFSPRFNRPQGRAIA